MDALQEIPVRSVRCFQKDDINNLSRSDTMFVGSLFSQYHLSKNNTVSSFDVNFVEVGMIRISDDNRSVMVSIQSCPWSRGKGLMKSMGID